MRMKNRRTRPITIKHKIVTRDSEGVPTISYGTPRTFTGEIWPVSDSLQALTYGDRVSTIMNMRLRGEYTIAQELHGTVYTFDGYEIREGDGVCVHSDDSVDFQIISVKPYKPIRMEIQKL